VTGWAAGVIEAHATLSRTLSAERFTDLAKQARAYFQKARSFSEKFSIAQQSISRPVASRAELRPGAECGFRYFEEFCH
jgi:hypothetical protein